MAKWTVTSRKVVFSNQWVDLHLDHITSSDKAETDYVYLTRTTTGLSIIPYFESADSVLLVRQYRHAVKKFLWQFPGGGRENGKSFKQTAKKELLDETGYEAGEMIDLGKYFPDAGISSDQGRVFVAVDLKKRFDKALTDPLEEIEVKKVTLNQLENMIQSGKIRDGWTLGTYTLFRLWLKKK